MFLWGSHPLSEIIRAAPRGVLQICIRETPVSVLSIIKLTIDLILQMKQSYEVYRQQLERFGDKIATMEKETSATMDAAMDKISTAIEILFRNQPRFKRVLRHLPRL